MSLRTKVIVTSPVWSLNGINLFSADLVMGLRARGIDARILLTGVTYREKKPIPFPKEVPFEQLRIPRAATWARRRESLRRYLIANAPCIYFPNHDFAHSCVSADLPANVGVIGIVHSDDAQHYDHFRRLGESWNAVVAVSSHIQSRLIEAGTVAPERVSLIPYGVPTADRIRSTRNDRPITIIYTGRLEENQKRVSMLLQIAEALTQRGVNFEMSIIGDGPERQNLAVSIAEKSLSNVRLIGSLDANGVREACAAHDVFVLTSRYEGMPISLLEAMGQGCIPVVTRMQSGIPELLDDGQNGFIIDSPDPQLFAERIQSLALNKEERERISARATTTISSGRFTTQAMVDSYLALIRNVESEMKDASFTRPALKHACPDLSLRDVIAAPLWSLRPSMRKQARI